MSNLELQFADAVGEPQAQLINDDPIGIAVTDEGVPQFASVPHATATVMRSRTGTWLRVFGERNSVHLNGRPVRHLAWVRAGDRIFLDGHSFFVVGESASDAGMELAAEGVTPGYSLRGLSADHFGQSMSLGQAFRVGTDAQADLRISNSSTAKEIARLTAMQDGVHLEMLVDDVTSQVNGLHVRHGLLKVGDQWVLNGRSRYVLESPGHSSVDAAEDFDDESDLAEHDAALLARNSERTQLMNRLGWIIAICALISLLVTGLIVYGPR